MKKTRLERTMEILPGILTWSTFILPVILSFYVPTLISILILTYAIYWLIKTIVMSIHLIRGYQRFKQGVAIDWFARLQSNFPKDEWRHLYHMIIITTYKEELPTLRVSFQSLAESNYPSDRLIVVLGVEERDEERGAANARAIEKEFGPLFHSFMTVMHPDNLPGETRGKGSNMTWAIRRAKTELVDKEGIAYEDIIVTSLDADHRVDPQYFANLTHTYLNTPDPIHKCFQPIPLFFNNIWQAAFPMRLISMGSSFWQMIEATRPWRLRTFASHAQSFAGLVKTDFWSISSIVEDGHQYWRSYFRFRGNFSVIPLFVPIYQDTVIASSGSFLDSCREQYFQKRRWAYGASDIPYAVQEALRDKVIPWKNKWLQVFRLIEGHYSWSTTSLVLLFVGWIPIIVNIDYRTTVFAYNFPYFYRYILTAAMVGMIVTLVISTLLIPPPPAKSKKLRRARLILEWILTPIILPVSNVLFGSLPAIDSQTRLLIKRYLGEFRVTAKKPPTENIIPPSLTPGV